MVATILQENYNDSLEYVHNLKRLGMSEEMATYQTRYSKNYVEKTIKEVIADLHLEQFATKQDIKDVKQGIDSLRQETKVEISKMKFTLLTWQIGIGVASVTTMYTIMSSIMNNLMKTLGH
jgi:hypothetical protein